MTLTFIRKTMYGINVQTEKVEDGGNNLKCNFLSFLLFNIASVPGLFNMYVYNNGKEKMLKRQEDLRVKEHFLPSARAGR